MSFEGQTIVITGAAGNLGRAVAAVFASGGARLALIDADGDVLSTRFADLEPRHGRFAVDLIDGESVARTVAKIERDFGRVDALCAVAGGFHMGEPVHETSDETFDMMMDVNVRTLLNAVRAVVPGMIARGSGKIVAIGANAATKGAADMGAYIAAKSVVLRLTETMAAELRGKGINVNAILPSIIDTPANRQSMPKADPSRWVKPAEVASVAAFLCSPAAAAVHGALVPVTGLS